MQRLHFGLGALAVAALLGPRFSPAAPAALAPVLPSGGTVINALPFNIANPGLYYLEKNLTGAAGQNGISISSIGAVVIDLNGYTITGAPDQTGTAIYGATAISAEVRNGKVHLWNRGIELNDAAVVSDVEVITCVEFAIQAGERSRISRCSTILNDKGIRTESFSTVEDCSVSLSQSVGVEVEAFCTVRDTTVSFGDTGILAGKGSRISECVIWLAGYGISTPTLLGAGVHVSDCTASECSEVGIAVRDQGIVTRCNTFNNEGQGIAVLGKDCVVRENASNDNGTTGISVEGSRARIEGNTINGNATGLAIVGVDNLVIGNLAAKNTVADFQIPFHNQAGPTLSNTWFIQGSNPQANFRAPFP